MTPSPRRTPRTHRRARALLIAALVAGAGLAAGPAARARMAFPEQASLALAADRTAYDAGTTAHLAAQVTIAPGWPATSHKPTFETFIPTTLPLPLPAGWPAPALRYPAASLKKFGFEEQPLAVYDGSVAVLADVAVPRGAARGPFPVKAALLYQACNDKECLPPVTAAATLTVVVGPGGVATGIPGGPGLGRPHRPPAGGAGLGLMLAVGLLGGLILNAMPCVLPILSLKVFGLVRSAAGGR